ncbi:hypothetical protein GF339_02665, partial [candidate division KSB3 bacterium]|nr:hypothetical protein [candidate division KSB3 bacterium]MBD3323457.1 hypothetical protein [candidate division KSB3 bacterium]
MEEIPTAALLELRKMRQELHDLKQTRPSARRHIELMLRRRGIKTIKYTPLDRLVLPEDCSPATTERFYQLMKKYSFRIFLRDLIHYRDHLTWPHLTKYCSPEVAQDYLATLLEHQIVSQVAPQQYQFSSRNIRNFGDTLEWFVAQVIRKEFGAPATWGSR